MKNVIMYKKGECSWVRYIKKRIRHNLNFNCILTGPTGSGKTWSAMRKSYELDPEFDPELQIAFTFKGVMRIINNFAREGHPLSKRKYKVCIFDEPQTNISNREWNSKVNKLFNYLLSTFRHQNIVLFFCTPYSDFIDIASQKLLHSEWRMIGWSKKSNKAQIRPLFLEYNSRKKDFYRHSLYVIKNGQYNKYMTMNVDRIPDDIAEKYEKMKTHFTHTLNKRIEKELEDYENDGETPTEDLWRGRKALTDRQLEVMKLLAEMGSVTNVAKQLNTSKPAISQIKTASEAKGYRVAEFITKKQQQEVDKGNFP